MRLEVGFSSGADYTTVALIDEDSSNCLLTKAASVSLPSTRQRSGGREWPTIDLAPARSETSRTKARAQRRTVSRGVRPVETIESPRVIAVATANRRGISSTVVRW